VSSTSNTPPPSPEQRNEWELIASSSTQPGWTIHLQFVANVQNGNNFNASGLQQVLLFPVNTAGDIQYGDNGIIPVCSGNGISGSVSGSVTGNAVSGSFVADSGSPASFTFTGTLSADGSNFSGSYSGSSCSDSGTLTASQTPFVNGSFSGQLTFSGGPVATSATLAEKSDNSVSMHIQFTGLQPNPDNFTGTMIGNVAAVNGACPSGQSPGCNQGDPVTVRFWFNSQKHSLQVLPNGFLNGELVQH